MNYLDERIIVNITLKYPSLGDRLYRYDVAVDNEWENPVFIGNCFIGADVPQKTIDITDIVRNYYDFSYPYIDTEFQREWQVRIWLDKDELEHSYSDKIGIYPIYRYPNRKARMETPLSHNAKDWIMPALQGFNSDKKGEFLPHIPFVWSDKVDYNLAVDCGNVDDIEPYLYTGVNKTLRQNNYGIWNTQYKLSELWKAKNEAETLDWDWEALNTEETTGVYTMNIASLSPLHYSCKLPLTPRQLRYTSDDGGTYNIEQIKEFPFVADIQGDIIQGSYLDVYIEKEIDVNYANFYPTVVKDTTVKAHIVIDYQPVIDIDLVESVDGGTKSGNFVTATTNATTFNVIAEDADSGDVREETGLVTGKTFEWNDTEGIKTLKITTENGILCTISLADKSVADTGAEYLMQLQVASGNLILSFLDQQYDADATFRTYRVPDAPLEASSINIQNDGTDNLASSYIMRFVQNKQDIEVIYGEQTIDKTAQYIQIKTKINGEYYNYAVIDKTGKVYNGFATGMTQGPQRYLLELGGLKEGDFSLYIFNIKGSDYEVTKITTKDFGIAKIFIINLGENGELNLVKWNAVLNTSYTYQQYVASKNIIEVAKVDACPARYYLQWRDRYGSMQMQPFNSTIQYKQDFSRLETKNYRETRKLSNLSIQPKWTLNTGFLSDYKYPYYESLLVSPWIKLYDTQEDNIYDVIIKTTDYTEKTYLNQDANLFNLEIEVEQTDKQNILY